MSSFSSYGLSSSAIASVLALAGCNLIADAATLEPWLEGQNGPSASIVVADLLPAATRTAIVCPYSGDEANELFGEQVFQAYTDINDSANWLAWKHSNGAATVEELEFSNVDLCRTGAHSEGVRELQPRETLVFTKEAGVWTLTEIR